MMEAMPNDENIDEELERFRALHKHGDLLKMLDTQGLKVKKEEKSMSVLGSEVNVSTAPATGRGAARGRGTARTRAGATAATRGKGQLDVTVSSTV